MQEINYNLITISCLVSLKIEGVAYILFIVYTGNQHFSMSLKFLIHIVLDYCRQCWE